MKITTKHSIGDPINLGLYFRHRDNEIATITEIYIIVEKPGSISVSYWYHLGVEQDFIELSEDGNGNYRLTSK